jgi:Helicase HerA, central domain
MRLQVRWHGRRGRPSHEAYVMEVVTPRTNTAALTSAENFFGSMALGEPFSVELAADASRRQFLVRAASEHVRDQLSSQLRAAYPQAELRPVRADADPAMQRNHEQVAASVLRLRAPAFLPLRTFTDLDVDGDRAAQADPVLGLLNALGDLPTGWRGLSQIVLRHAPETWSRDYQRLSVQHPLEHERLQRPTENTGPTLMFVAMLLAILLAAMRGLELIRAERWGELTVLAVGAAVLLTGSFWGLRRLARPRLYDMELVREKTTRSAYYAEVRLIVFAPAGAEGRTVREQVDRLAAVYRRFNLAAANGFVPHRVKSDRMSASPPAPWNLRCMAVLTTLELAGIWHLPHAMADVALLERTSARRWLPLPAAVSDGCTIGAAEHQGYSVPVALPGDVLRRHLLLVAKTRRGKSTLMQRLACHSMETEPRRAVLVLDPHRDLAESLLGLVPHRRRPDVVFLDVANRGYPFGLNLLDTGLGWDRDRAVANTLSVFQREWGDRYWGPRMEDAFRYALLTLFEANLIMCREDPVQGRSRQYTLLEIPTLLSDTVFRRDLLGKVEDPTIRAWWSDYFDALERRFQLEVINPVLTKIHRFQGSTAARNIVGQAVSTIDPGAWLRDGAIVIVNTARGIVGENTAALVGSTLLNLVTLAVAEQASVHAADRRPISMYVDEFHTIPGADYEGILAELSKYGANLVLATQSLTRLLALGQAEGRGLRATVFANLDGLFAFNCSAEDAEYLVRELGGALDEQDLVELGEHQCYARISSGGHRLPTFSVRLDPPARSDAEARDELARASAERYGRPVADVEADRRAVLERVLQLRARHVEAAVAAAPSGSSKRPARNEHRPRKKQRQAESAGAG